jgi:hypothetical protein
VSNHRPPEQVLTKPVACWLTGSDYNRLLSASEHYGVKVAVYIRAVIIDALADEDDRKTAENIKEVQAKKINALQHMINVAPPGGYSSLQVPINI